MIAALRGRLVEKHRNQAIVEAEGVGYDVIIPVLPRPPYRRLERRYAYGFTPTCGKDALSLREFSRHQGLSIRCSFLRNA